MGELVLQVPKWQGELVFSKEVLIFLGVILLMIIGFLFCFFGYKFFGTILIIGIGTVMCYGSFLLVEPMTSNSVIRLFLTVSLTFLGVCLVYFLDIIWGFILDKLRIRNVLAKNIYLLAAPLGAAILGLTIYYMIWRGKIVAIAIACVCLVIGLVFQFFKRKKQVRFRSYNDLMKLPLPERYQNGLEYISAGAASAAPAPALVAEEIPAPEPEATFMAEEIPESEPETAFVAEETPESEPETAFVAEKTPEPESEKAFVAEIKEISAAESAAAVPALVAEVSSEPEVTFAVDATREPEPETAFVAEVTSEPETAFAAEVSPEPESEKAFTAEIEETPAAELAESEPDKAPAAELTESAAAVPALVAEVSSEPEPEITFVTDATREPEPETAFVAEKTPKPKPEAAFVAEVSREPETVFVAEASPELEPETVPVHKAYTSDIELMMRTETVKNIILGEAISEKYTEEEALDDALFVKRTNNAMKTKHRSEKAPNRSKNTSDRNKSTVPDPRKITIVDNQAITMKLDAKLIKSAALAAVSVGCFLAGRVSKGGD